MGSIIINYFHLDQILTSPQQVYHWDFANFNVDCFRPFLYNNNNNNQAFYSQASWGRLEMKPHESKKQGQNKSKKEGENKGR
jgi:hypothetical protein